MRRSLCHWIISVSALVVAQLPLSSARAQEALTEPTEQAPAFESVVSAARYSQSVLEAPRATSVKTATEIQEQQARDIPSATAEMPGVYLQQTNRGAGSPILRGMVGPANLIVVDGVRFNNGTFRTGPNQYLALIDPTSVGRLEIVRGPSSVLYGNGAMGGVISIDTKEPRFQDGYGAQATAWGQTADWGRGLALQVDADSGPFALLVGGMFGQFDALRAGGGYKVPVSDYHQRAMRAKASARLSDRWLLSLSYLGMSVRDAGRSDQLGLGDLRFYDNDDHLAYTTLDYVGAGHLSRFVARLSLHQTLEEVERYSCRLEDAVVRTVQGCADRQSDEITGVRRYRDTVQTLGADIQADWRFFDARLVIVTGVDAYHDTVHSSLHDARNADEFVSVQQPRGNFSDGSTYTSAGAFLHAQGTLLDFGESYGAFLAQAGTRVSHFRASAPDVPLLGDISYDFTGLVGTAGLQWLRSDVWSIHAAFMQGFRAPNLQETTVLGDTGSKFEIPNARLRPERSDTWELGGRARFAGLRMGVTGFYTQLQDAIDDSLQTFNNQEAVDGKPVVQRVNTASGRYYGVEGELSWHLGRLKIFGHATYMQGSLQGANGEAHPARRIPPLFGLLGARWTVTQHGYIEVFAQGALRQAALHPSDARDSRICETAPFSGQLQNPCRAPAAWLTANVRTGWQITPSLRTELALYNFTDQRFRVFASGMDAAGFDARLSLVGKL